MKKKKKKKMEDFGRVPGTNEEQRTKNKGK
ncbi:hypothetical protein A2U01_0100483, partial [Trifolium medium]|nr:hypothetical protein [Trifolium medium]